MNTVHWLFIKNGYLNGVKVGLEQTCPRETSDTSRLREASQRLGVSTSVSQRLLRQFQTTSSANQSWNSLLQTLAPTILVRIFDYLLPVEKPFGSSM